MDQLSLFDLLELENPTAMEQFYYWVDETNYTKREMELIYEQPSDASVDEVNALVEKANELNDERIAQMLGKEYSYLYGNKPFQITDQKYSHLLAERVSDPAWRNLDEKLDGIWYKNGNPNERIIWNREENQMRLKWFGEFCVCNCHNQFLYVWKISKPVEDGSRTVKIWQYVIQQQDKKARIIHSVQLTDKTYTNNLVETLKSNCSGEDIMNAINDIFAFESKKKQKRKRNDPLLKDLLNILSFMRKLFYNDRTTWKYGGEGIEQWRSYCDNIKAAILSGDQDISDFAIKELEKISYGNYGRESSFYFKMKNLSKEIEKIKEKK